MVSVGKGVIFDILHEYFSKCVVEEHQSDESSDSFIFSNAAMKMIYYHVCYCYNRNVLASILPIVKQLDKLQLLTKSLEEPVFAKPQPTSYSNSALTLLDDSNSLCSYIVDVLFNIVGSMWLKGRSTNWLRFYQNMVKICMNTFYCYVVLELFLTLQVTTFEVKRMLYKFMNPSLEGKLNILHTAYVVVQCDITDCILINAGCSAYWTLFNKFFSEQKVIMLFFIS